MTLASVLSPSTTKLMYMYTCPYKEVGAVWGTKSVCGGGRGEFSVINYVKYVIALSYKGLGFGPTHTHFNKYLKLIHIH